MGNQQLEKCFKGVYIKGYENKYMISVTGEVYGCKRQKVLAPKITRFGYKEVGLSNGSNGIRKVSTRFVHKLVAEAFIPNDENKAQVNHKDGDKLNNFVGNLEWCSAAENIQHSWQLGLSNPARPNLGRPVKGAKSKYRNVIYIGHKHAFRAVVTKVTDINKKLVKTKLFSISKYGYERAERLAAEAVNTFIDSIPEFADIPKNEIFFEVQRPSSVEEYTQVSGNSRNLNRD